jgi:hypothetical protein
MPARYELDGDVAEIVIDHGALNLWDPDLIADVEDGVAGGGGPPPPRPPPPASFRPSPATSRC